MMQRFVLWMAFFFLLAQAKSQNPVELFQKANNHFDKNEYKECIALLQSIEKQIGANPKIYSLYVRAYLAIPDYTNAAISMNKFKKLVAGKSSQAITDVLSLEPEISAGLERAQQDHQKNVQINRNKEADAVVSAIEHQKQQQKQILQQNYGTSLQDVLNNAGIEQVRKNAALLPDSLKRAFYLKTRNSKKIEHSIYIRFTDSTLRFVNWCSYTTYDSSGAFNSTYSISYEANKYPAFMEEMTKPGFYSKINKQAVPASFTVFKGTRMINGNKWREYQTSVIDAGGNEIPESTSFKLFRNKLLLADSFYDGIRKHVYRWSYSKDDSRQTRFSYLAFKNDEKDYQSIKTISSSNDFNASYTEKIESLEEVEARDRKMKKWEKYESTGTHRYNLYSDLTYESFMQSGKRTSEQIYRYTYDNYGYPVLVENRSTYFDKASAVVTSYSANYSVTINSYTDGYQSGLPEYYHRLGVSAYNAKQYEEAILLYQKALQLKPEYQLYALNLAYAFYESGKTEQALTQLNQLIDRDPEYAAAYHALGLVYIRSGERARGVENIKKAAEMGSSGAKEWLKANNN